MVQVKLILSRIMVKAKKIAIPLVLLKVLIIVIRKLVEQKKGLGNDFTSFYNYSVQWEGSYMVHRLDQ